jgi:hypothetical protein
VRAVKVPDEPGLPPAQCSFLLIDTPGSATFTQRDAFARHWAGANLLALMFDVGSRESFMSCAKWLRRAQETRATAGSGAERALHGVVIGCKADFRAPSVERAEVSEAEARAFAEANGMAYFEVSAERGTGIDKPFVHLASLFRRMYEKDMAAIEEGM